MFPQLGNQNDQSQISVRMYIFVELKGYIRDSDFEELFEKAYNIITKGITLPTIAKKESDIFAATLQTIAQGYIQKPDNKEQETETKKAYEKYCGKYIKYKDKPCIVCGYSEEMKCLICACEYEPLHGVTLGENDVLSLAYSDKTKHSYFYISIFEVERQLNG